MAVDEFRLTASDAAAAVQFGATASLDGDTVIVGTAKIAAAYVFVRSGSLWTEQAKLTPSDGAAGFGLSVAIHGDTAVVGAPNARAAYVFVRSGTVWDQQAKLEPGDAKAGFGYAVAVHGDTVIVGATSTVLPFTEPGAAYAFVRSGTTWNEQQKLSASDEQVGNFFGGSVAVQGEVALIGAERDDGAGLIAGAAYAFVRSGTVWNEEQKLTGSDTASMDQFGNAVALSASTAIIGALFDDENGFNAGAAYVFVRGAAGWSEQQKLVASDGAAEQRFGISVDVDGDTALIAAFLYDEPVPGASSDTYAYIFIRDEDSWSEAEKLVTGSGSSVLPNAAEFVAISGCSVVVGTELDDDAAMDAGAAFAYLIGDCPCTDPVQGLVSWWTLDQLSSPARDVAGPNDGAWVNNPTPVQGIVDGALQFDGTQHVEVLHHPSLNFGADRPFTIDAWIRPLAISPRGSIVSKQDPGSGRGYALRLIDGRLAFSILDGSTSATSFLAADVLPLDSWTFVAVTVDRATDTGLAYVNGEKVGSFAPSNTATATIDNSHPLFIAHSVEDGDRFVGSIDEVEVFERALEPDEIMVVYSALSGGKCKPCVDPPPGMVAWWTFDEASGSNAADIAGPHDGTHVGGPMPAPGLDNLSLAFTAVGQHVQVEDHPELNFGNSGSFSIDGWIRPAEVENLAIVIMQKWDGTNRVGYRLFMRSGLLVFFMGDGSNPQPSYISQNAIQKEAWSFLTVTVDRDLDEGRVYINGLLDGTFVPSSKAPGSISNNAPLFIGGTPRGETLPGRVDELEIYGRVLTDSEINDLFIAGTEGKCKPG